jgi:hypothetical protein
MCACSTVVLLRGSAAHLFRSVVDAAAQQALCVRLAPDMAS